MQINGTVRQQSAEIAGPTIVLIHDSMHAIADNKSRVTSRTVSDRCFNMYGDGQIIAEVAGNSVASGDEVSKT